MSNSSWLLGPFTDVGQILDQESSPQFTCPILGTSVTWAAKDVFNPAAVVRDGRVHLLVRAEDAVGRYSGTSRVGLATSDDGVHFTLSDAPVLFPDTGTWQAWEWPGGCEDPRVVESPDGGYVCLYTAFNGTSSCLFVATSDDLITWEKHGPAFGHTPYVRRWSKSGAVVTAVVDSRLVATRMDGRFLMYWGEGTCFAATSEDLVHWKPVEFDAGADRYLTYQDGTGKWDIHRISGQRVLRPLLAPRRGRFDSLLVEPGPPAVITEDGIVLIYNGAHLQFDQKGEFTGVTYQPGQVLFDPCDPCAPLARSTEPSFMPGDDADLSGQVDDVCFAQGLVLFNDTWFLYYGMADSRIGCARAEFLSPR